MQVRSLIHCLSNIVAISIQNKAKKVNKVDESVAWRRNYKIYEETFQKGSWDTKVDTNAQNKRIKQPSINKQQQTRTAWMYKIKKNESQGQMLK